MNKLSGKQRIGCVVILLVIGGLVVFGGMLVRQGALAPTPPAPHQVNIDEDWSQVYVGDRVRTEGTLDYPQPVLCGYVQEEWRCGIILLDATRTHKKNLWLRTTNSTKQERNHMQEIVGLYEAKDAIVYDTNGHNVVPGERVRVLGTLFRDDAKPNEFSGIKVETIEFLSK